MPCKKFLSRHDDGRHFVVGGKRKLPKLMIPKSVKKVAAQRSKGLTPEGIFETIEGRKPTKKEQKEMWEIVSIIQHIKEIHNERKRKLSAAGYKHWESLYKKGIAAGLDDNEAAERADREVGLANTLPLSDYLLLKKAGYQLEPYKDLCNKDKRDYEEMLKTARQILRGGKSKPTNVVIRYIDEFGRRKVKVVEVSETVEFYQTASQKGWSIEKVDPMKTGGGKISKLLSRTEIKNIVEPFSAKYGIKPPTVFYKYNMPERQNASYDAKLHRIILSTRFRNKEDTAGALLHELAHAARRPQIKWKAQYLKDITAKTVRSEEKMAKRGSFKEIRAMFPSKIARKIVWREKQALARAYDI